MRSRVTDGLTDGRSWLHRTRRPAGRVQKVIGFDANALYLSCTRKSITLCMIKRTNTEEKQTIVKKVFNGLNILEPNIILIYVMHSMHHMGKSELEITVSMDFVDPITLYMNISCYTNTLFIL